MAQDFIIPQGGVPTYLQADIYRGRLVEPGTIVPVWDAGRLEEALAACAPERRAALETLLGEGRAALRAEQAMARTVRRNHGKPEPRGQDAYDDVFTRLRHRPNPRFPHGTVDVARQLWAAPELQPAMQEPPRAERLTAKLARGDYRFGPIECAQLAREVKHHSSRVPAALLEAIRRVDPTRPHFTKGRQLDQLHAEFLYRWVTDRPAALRMLDDPQGPGAAFLIERADGMPIRRLIRAGEDEAAQDLLDRLDPAKRRAFFKQHAITFIEEAYLPWAMKALEEAPESVWGESTAKRAMDYASRRDNLPLMQAIWRQYRTNPQANPAPAWLGEVARAIARWPEPPQEMLDWLKPLLPEPLPEVEQHKGRWRSPPMGRWALPVRQTPPSEADAAPDPFWQRQPGFNRALFDTAYRQMAYAGPHGRGYGQRFDKKAYAQIAGQIACLFPDIDTYEAFCQQHAPGARGMKTLRETFWPTIWGGVMPRGIDYAAWGHFLRKYGAEALVMYPYAEEIERGFLKLNEARVAESQPPFELRKSTLGVLHEAWLQSGTLHYEGKPLVLYGAQYRLSDYDWQSVQEAVVAYQRRLAEQGGPLPDLTPDIGVIDGKDFGHPHYYMARLPKGDLRHLIINKFVGNCTGPSDSMARATYMAPDVGLYCIFRKQGEQPDLLHDRIVAKVTVSYSKPLAQGGQGLIFNAWERHPIAKRLCVPFFREAAERAVAADPRIARVQMGHTITGHNPAEWGAFPEVEEKLELANEAGSKGDLRVQYLVYGTPSQVVRQQERAAQASRTR